MSTVPLDAPTPVEELTQHLSYASARYREYDEAFVALLRLRDAYATFGAALAKAGAAVAATQVYNPEEWFEAGRPLEPLDLHVPSRVKQFLTHDPEQFLEANVLLGAMSSSMRVLAEAVEADVVRLTREVRESEQGAAV